MFEFIRSTLYNEVSRSDNQTIRSWNPNLGPGNGHILWIVKVVISLKSMVDKDLGDIKVFVSNFGCGQTCAHGKD